MADRRTHSKQSDEGQSDIARITAEITALRSMRLKIDETSARYRGEDLPPCQRPTLPDGRSLTTFFGRVDNEAMDAIDALTEELSIREPETIADVLSQALVLGDDIDTFLTNFIGEGSEDADGYQGRKLQRRIERLQRAIVRGLSRLCPGHPLAAYDREGSGEWDSATLAETFAEANSLLAEIAAEGKGGADV